MEYIALYRKWRPLVFEDVVEQDYVVKTLKNTIQSKRIAHSYLFSGTRGTGKTTMAKIFARGINCTNNNSGDPCNECEICKGLLNGNILDVIEIDAASNNSVENVRNIREEVVYAPSFTQYKVYIIDEVHMLSQGAFNALLKTLEEPPKHVVFILATTESHKIPATILSRCQRFDFKRISLSGIASRLQLIANSNNITIDDEATQYIAKLSDGALRDSISILDQCISLGLDHLTYSDISSIIGGVDNEHIKNMSIQIIEKNIINSIYLLKEIVDSGKDLLIFCGNLITFFRNLMLLKSIGINESILEISSSEQTLLLELSANIDSDEIICIIKELSLLENSLKWLPHPKISFEVILIKLCNRTFSRNNDNLNERLSQIENKISNGAFVSSSPNTPISPVINTASQELFDSLPSTLTPEFHGIKIPQWNQIVKGFQEIGRVVIYSHLIESDAYLLDHNHVGIALKELTNIAKITLKKQENSEVIEKALFDLFNKEIKIKIIESSNIDENISKDDSLIEELKNIAISKNIPFKVIED